MSIPGRIEAALAYLKFADSLRNPYPAFDGCGQEARDLTAPESKVETAALKLLQDYFDCVADFGDWGRDEVSDTAVELEMLRDQVDILERKTNGLLKTNTSSSSNSPKVEQPPLE